MERFELLDKKEIMGDGILDILKKRGIFAAVTDFSLALGTATRRDGFIGKEKRPDQRKGCYWIKDKIKNIYESTEWGRSYINKYIWTVGSFPCDREVESRECGIRPIMRLDSLEKLPKNKGSKVKRAADGILEVELGYYPQTAASKKIQRTLTKKLKLDELKKTGNVYVTDNGAHKFAAEENYEYEYKGKRYVNVLLKDIGWDFEVKLSNGENFPVESSIWVEVEPVKWLVDEKSKVMLTEKIITGGIHYSDCSDKDDIDFEKINVMQYMNNHLKKEMLQSEIEYVKVEGEKREEEYMEERVHEYKKEDMQNNADLGVKAYRKIGEGYNKHLKKEKAPKASSKKNLEATNNISERELFILRKLLGDDMTREFKRFLGKRNHGEVYRGNSGYLERSAREFVVDVRNFRERDLVGYWDYDDDYINDRIYWEPEWFNDLKRECRKNPNERFVVIFKGSGEASGVVYGRLKKFQETGHLCDEIVLPPNALYGKVELENRRNDYRYVTRRNRDEEEEYANPFDYRDYDVLR